MAYIWSHPLNRWFKWPPWHCPWLHREIIHYEFLTIIFCRICTSGSKNVTTSPTSLPKHTKLFNLNASTHSLATNISFKASFNFLYNKTLQGNEVGGKLSDDRANKLIPFSVSSHQTKYDDYKYIWWAT